MRSAPLAVWAGVQHPETVELSNTKSRLYPETVKLTNGKGPLYPETV